MNGGKYKEEARYTVYDVLIVLKKNTIIKVEILLLLKYYFCNKNGWTNKFIIAKVCNFNMNLHTPNTNFPQNNYYRK